MGLEEEDMGKRMEVSEKVTKFKGQTEVLRAAGAQVPVMDGVCSSATSRALLLPSCNIYTPAAVTRSFCW